jgi:predicted acyl esterase
MALGVASRRPKGLKAVASVYGAADIYHDFVYPGGCPNGLGASAWSALMIAFELAPPSLQDPAGLWLEAWKARLDRLADGDISMLVWPAHEEYDEYWQRRRIAVEEITAPTFFLSGWRDLLCQGMTHAYERCNAPKRLLVGPWSHAAPDLAPVGAYDWLSELRGWWDEWLKDEPPSERRPAVTLWMQRDETWRSCAEWPPPAAREETTLTEAARFEYRCVSDVGSEAGLWYPMALEIGSFDQTKDDAKSLCFTSDPLAEQRLVVGAPRAALRVEVPEDEEVRLAVKLCDVDPQGRSTLITSGWCRIPAGPAREVEAEVELYPTAYAVAAGHCVRWAIAGSDFPRIWPTATEPTIAILAPSSFTVPFADEASLPHLDAPLPDVAADRAGPLLSAEPVCRFVRDEAAKRFSVTAGVNVKVALEQGGTFSLENLLTASIAGGVPMSAHVKTSAVVTIELASGETVRAAADGLSAAGRRHISGELTADGQTLYERRWTSLRGELAG